MRPDRYAVIYRWFAARPAALTALRLANRWEIRHGGISGRTAQQMINYLAGKAPESGGK